MSSKNKNQLSTDPGQRPTHEVKRRVRAARYGRQAAAVTLATLAGTGQVATAVAAPSPSKAPIVYKAERHHLKTVEQLPGYNLRVTPEQRREQRAAVVQIVYQENGGASPDTWGEWCTAYRVRVAGTAIPYLLSNGHCFADQTGSSSGVFTDLSAPQNKAENFVNFGKMTYAITTPNKFTDSQYTNSIFPIDGISVDTANRDAALLRMLPLAPAMGDPSANPQTNYEDIPAIPASKFIGDPIPGEEVSLLGSSTADGAVLQYGTGRYLGRVNLNTTNTDGAAVEQQLYIVGIKADLPAADVCNYGDSGSVAQFATGSYTGGASIRFNFGYGSGKDKIWQPEDYDYRADNRMSVDMIEEQTGVSTKGFTTLCAYTVMGKNTINQLVNGFDVPATSSFSDQPKN